MKIHLYWGVVVLLAVSIFSYSYAISNRFDYKKLGENEMYLFDKWAGRVYIQTPMREISWAPVPN